MCDDSSKIQIGPKGGQYIIKGKNKVYCKISRRKRIRLSQTKKSSNKSKSKKEHKPIIKIVKRGEKGFLSIASLIKRECNELCQHMVLQTYIEGDALPLVDVVIGAFLQPSQLQGFVLIQIKRKELFIDVICAKGIGKVLIEETIKYAYSKKKKLITLHALPYVINYYRKLGFKLNRPGKCGDEKHIEEDYPKEIRDLKFKNQVEALHNEEFVKAL
ncbi:MAG: GNAT family N-acetyltransferase, partial [Nanoarchaeota archaeon]